MSMHKRQGMNTPLINILKVAFREKKEAAVSSMDALIDQVELNISQ